MAVSHVSTSTPAGNTGAFSLSWPAGHQEGDLAIVYLASGSTSTAMPTPAGCTSLFGKVGKDAGTVTGHAANLRVAYIWATSSSMPDISIDDPSTYAIAALTVLRGVDPTDPIFAYNSYDGKTSSTSANRTFNLAAPYSGLTAPTLALAIMGFGDNIAGSSTNYGSFIVNTAFDGGTYEGCLMVAVGEVYDTGTSPTFTVSSSPTRSNDVVGWVIPRPAPEAQISGTTDGSITVVGTMVATGALAGTSTNVLSGDTAALIGFGELLGSNNATLTTNASLSGTGELVGSSNVTLTVTGVGQAITDSLLSANVALTSSATGTLGAFGSLAGSSDTVLDASGNLTGVGALAGNAGGAISVSGGISQLNEMSANVSLTLTVPDATLSGSFTLGGTSASVGTATGTLQGLGTLIGTSNNTINVVGTGKQSVFLAGQSSNTLTAVGALRGLVSASVANNFRNYWLAVYSARQALLNKMAEIAKTTLDSHSTSITSLQNSITDLVSGQTAQSNAMTLLSSRVTNTEGQISAQGLSITSLGAAIADKADVTVTNSLSARVSSIESKYGYNLLLNPGLVVDARNWINVVWNSAARPEWSHGRNHLGDGYRVSGTNNFGISFAGTTTTAGEYYAVTGDKFPAEAGDYILTVLLSMVQLEAADVTIEAYDATGTYIADACSHYNNQTGWSGGPNRANWRTMSASFTAPSGTKYMALRTRVRTKTTGVNPRFHMMEAMLERKAPGQTVPTPFNLGPTAAWAEWDLSFNVNGYVSGIKFSSNGSTSDFVVDADVFQVKSIRANKFLSWSNGTLWNKGTDYSVILGQDLTPDEDVILWIGPNPTSPQLAAKNDASIYFTETGNAVFRGVIQQGLLMASALELGSTRIHVGGGRLAPFTIRDYGYKGQPVGGTNFSTSIVLAGFKSPAYGDGYIPKRFSRQKLDVVLHATLDGDGSGNESVYIEVQYDNGAWLPIVSRTNINVDYRGGFSLLVRYTTIESWTDVAFRARTTNNNTICLAFAVTVDNCNESGNTAGSSSNMDATTGIGGTPPVHGGGGGGGGGGGDDGGSYCVVAELTYLPDGSKVAEASNGEAFPCWNGDIEAPAIEMHPLLGMPFGYAHSYLVVAENGASVAQSETTPIPLRDGRLVRTLECLDQEVLTNIDGELAWSRVVALNYLGLVRVAKPDLGDRVFFAGITPNATIATHNIRQKDSL